MIHISANPVPIKLQIIPKIILLNWKLLERTETYHKTEAANKNLKRFWGLSKTKKNHKNQGGVGGKKAKISYENHTSGG